jgi:hypothetical protein
MQAENKQVDLINLAQILNVNPSWLGATLQKVGLTIQADGTVPTTDIINTLFRSSPPLPRKNLTRGDIKILADEARVNACTALNHLGIKVIDPLERKLWHLKRADNKEATLKIHVATSVKSHPGQLGFSVTLPGPPCRWVLLILEPWQRFALKNTDELQHLARTTKTRPYTVAVTFSVGVSKWDLVNRIDDFLADPLAWV